MDRREGSTVLAAVRAFRDEVITMEGRVGRTLVGKADRQRHAASYISPRHIERITLLRVEEIDRPCDRITRQGTAR